MLEREGRIELAKKCFEALNIVVELDIKGWQNEDIFAH
jgi:ribonuclease D